MVEPVILLGAAVVKAACKVWAGDSPFAQNVEATVVDLVAQRVSGWREQREVRRQFDQLEEQVAVHVLRYIGHEFPSLIENEKNSAILAVKDTFDHARLTDRVLFQQDLDPLYLEGFLRRSVPDATRDLGESASGLYNRLLTECCAYVIAVTTTLPRFNAEAFTEILKRQSFLIQTIDQVLTRLPGQDDSASETHSTFTTAYRRHVATKWDRMRLFGADVSTRNYPLSVAYITLNVTSEARLRAVTGRPSVGVQSVDSALQGTSRIFLRGAPGSGKTTLLHWLAVRAARDDFPASLKEWSGAIPFFVPLREYAEKEFPDDPSAFLRHAGIHLPAQAPREWAALILSEGRGLFLIDGIDELPRERREGARWWLKNLIADFGSCRYIVTTRSAAANPDWLESEGFDSASLEPLNAHGVQAFVQRWYEAVISETADQEERQELARNERNLSSLILSTRHLLNLARTPLLCALLCALYRDHRTVLPRDRMELYEAALMMLLERRDIERGIDKFGLDLSRREKVLLLQDLAYWLMTNGLSEAAEPRVIRLMERTVSGMRHVTVSADIVYRYLLERSGVLYETAAGWTGFIHRTFEEYLAGKAFVDNDQLDMLISNAENDQWREVVVMAAGHAPGKQRVDLIRRLLAKADRVSRPRGLVFPLSAPDFVAQNSLLITAFACLENIPNLPPDLAASLRKHAPAIMPPKTMEEATTLAAAGEFGLSLLAEQKLEAFGSAGRLIRAASLVGGREALALIKRTVRSPEREYSEDRWSQDDMISAWLRFDPDEFAREVISGTRYGRSLRIRNPELLGSLHLVEGLHNLHLEEECRLDDVGQLRGLKVLAIDDIADLSPVAQYNDLTELRVAGVLNADLSPLTSLNRLEVLQIRYATQGINFDAAPLKEMRSLKHLRVYGVSTCNLTALNRIKPSFETDAPGMVVRGW